MMGRRRSLSIGGVHTRFMATVPRGLLRYYILELLSGSPMSGSEIMDTIERESGGLWRPSPGSIYPLLEWLRERGYIKEVKTNEVGVKKYVLTERGEEFLKWHREVKNFLKKSCKFFTPYFLELKHSGLEDYGFSQLKNSIRNFMERFVEVEILITRNPSKEAVNMFTTILNEASMKLEDLKKSIEGGSSG
ncbi:MAG: PadR family transcriptional regulator [Nitrososphaerota archaeon]